MTMAGHGTTRGRRREFSPLGAFALSAALLALGFYRRPGERAAPDRAGRERETLRGEDERLGVARAPAEMAPTEIPARVEAGLMGRVYYAVSEHRVPAIAAGVAFYSLLAIVAAIAGIAALYALYADPATIRSHFQAISSFSTFLPAGVVAFVADQITRLAAQGETTRAISAAIASLFALWSANAGMKAVFDALDVAHQEREKRNFLALNSISLSFTVLGILLIAAAMAVIVGWPTLIDNLNLSPRTERLAGALRWPLLILVVSLAISVLYRFGPSRARAHWQWLSAGSLFAAVAWLAMAVLLSLYAESLALGRFDAFYGSFGAIVAFLIWLWLSNVALLTGAELDAQSEARLAED